MQRVLNSISIFAAVAVIWLNQSLWGIYNGFAYGAGHICDYSYPTFTNENGVSYWISHADPYFYLVNWHQRLSFALIAFVILKVLERGRVLAVLGLVLLGPSIFFWILANGVRSIDIDDPDKYLDVLRETTTQTQVILALIVFLLLVQTISIFFYFRNHRTKQLENTV